MATFLGTLFIVICILLIIVVLLQKGRGGGLGAAFGGAGSSAFGTRTGDVFTWVTIVLTALFLLLAIGSNFAFRPERKQIPAPVFSPEPGPIPGVREVRILADPRAATIYYTLDGSTPTKDSARYADLPLEILPGTTIKAIAYYKTMIPSEVATASYPLAEPESRPAGPRDTATQPVDGGGETVLPDIEDLVAPEPVTP